MSLLETKQIYEQAVQAVADQIAVLEPGMPADERERLAQGLLGVLVEWSCGGKPLPESVREWLTLEPWKGRVTA